MIVVNTKKFNIEKYNEKDILDRYNLLSNEDIMKFNRDYLINDFNQIERQTKDIINQKNDILFHYKVVNKENNQYLGEVRYQIIGQLNEFQLVGVQTFILDIKNNQDLITEVLNSFINYLFNNNVLKAIFKVNKDDLEMIKIYNELEFIMDKKIENSLEYKVIKRSWKYANK